MRAEAVAGRRVTSRSAVVAGMHRRAAAVPLRALALIAVVAAAALGTAVPALADLSVQAPGWPTFFLLAAGALASELFVVLAPRTRTYHASIAFVIAAALLLPPGLVVLVGIVQHVPEWLRLRTTWFARAFDVCTFTLSGLAAWGVAHVTDAGGGAFGNGRWALAATLACVVFVLVNHALLAAMLHFGRGQSMRATGLLGAESFATDGVLASLGVTVAALWHWNHWLVPFALLPLLLAQRALRVPALQEQARTDGKTGLLNPRAFGESLDHELARAVRFGRSLSVLVLDLDHLREINNSYGHLAGDAALVGVADVLRQSLREYDVACRFGGEEFAVLLPETGHLEALEIAERVRETIARKQFIVPATGETMRVTTSVGVASVPIHGRGPQSLLHAADTALYAAKAQGRDRVVGAAAA